MPAAQRIYHIVYKIEQLIDQYPGIDFLFLTKIDQAAIDTIPAGAPFIFVDQRAGILYKIEVL